MALGEKLPADPDMRGPKERGGGGLVLLSQSPLHNQKGDSKEEYRWDAASHNIQEQRKRIEPGAIMDETWESHGRHRIDLSRAANSLNELTIPL